MGHVTTEQVETAVAPLRAMLQLDGGDLLVVETGDTSATFAIELENASCAECVLPAEMIESIIAKELAGSIPQITEVVVRDPRVEGAAPGTSHG